MPDKFSILKKERTSIDLLIALSESLCSDIFTIPKLMEICAQLHADFFLTLCALETSDKDYINEMRSTLSNLFQINSYEANHG